jgi:hypothetical protein
MGLNDLNKHAKVSEKIEYETPVKKKTDWVKITLLIIKLLEPEMKKLPKVFIVIPISLLWFLLLGGYKSFSYVIKLVLTLI